MRLARLERARAAKRRSIDGEREELQTQLAATQAQLSEVQRQVDGHAAEETRLREALPARAAVACVTATLPPHVQRAVQRDFPMVQAAAQRASAGERERSTRSSAPRAGRAPRAHRRAGRASGHGARATGSLGAVAVRGARGAATDAPRRRRARRSAGLRR